MNINYEAIVKLCDGHASELQLNNLDSLLQDVPEEYRNQMVQFLYKDLKIGSDVFANLHVAPANLYHDIKDLPDKFILDKLTEIGASAFQGSNVGLVKIKGPVTSVGENAFADCSKLRQVTFDDNSTFPEFGKGAFKNCPLLNAVKAPESLAVLDWSDFEGSDNVVVVIREDMASKIMMQDDTEHQAWYEEHVSIQ